MAVLDELDFRLLTALQQDNQRTADQLSETIGLSPSAIARRLRRLRESGAVQAEVAIVSERVAGNQLSAIVHVQLERHEAKDGDRLRRRLVASPNVQLCLDVAGSVDIVLLVVARDMQAYNEFADSLLEENPAVRRFETTFVKRRLKSTLAYPLPGMPEA